MSAVQVVETLEEWFKTAVLIGGSVALIYGLLGGGMEWAFFGGLALAVLLTGIGTASDVDYRR